MLLFNLLFYYLVSNVVILFICIWNFFYDGKINTYVHNNLSPSFRHKKYLAHIGTPGNAENNCTKLPGFGFTKLGSYIREMMRNITCQWKVFNVENPWAVFYGFFQYFLFYCKMIFFIFYFFLNWDHSMQGWTATTRHGVTRKKSTKRLHHTGNLFRKNLQLKDIC